MGSRAHSGESGPGMPRWVKNCGIAGIVVALLIVVMLLVGGEHGPSRHTQGAGAIVAGVAVVDGGGWLPGVGR